MFLKRSRLIYHCVQGHAKSLLCRHAKYCLPPLYALSSNYSGHNIFSRFKFFFKNELIRLIIVSTVFEIFRKYKSREIAADYCYRQTERRRLTFSEQRVGEASADTIMFKPVAIRSLLASSSISQVI